MSAGTDGLAVGRAVGLAVSAAQYPSQHRAVPAAYKPVPAAIRATDSRHGRRQYQASRRRRPWDRTTALVGGCRTLLWHWQHSPANPVCSVQCAVCSVQHICLHVLAVCVVACLCALAWRDEVLHCVACYILWHAVGCHAVRCCAVSCCAVHCCAVPCRAMRCCAVLYCAAEYTCVDASMLMRVLCGCA